jgi:uncharacterized protein
VIRPLNSDDARTLVRNGHVGRLGCIADGGPYVVPVSYIFDNGAIFVHSLTGRKVRAMRENPRVCFQVDEIRDEYNWRSAIVFGRYKEVTEPAEREWALRRILTRFPRLTPVESLPVHDGSSSIVIFRIDVEEITGVHEG